MDTKKTAVLLDTPQQQAAGQADLLDCGSGAPGAWPLGFATWLGGEGARSVLRRPLVLIVTLGSPMSPAPPVTHLQHGTALKIHVGFLGC